MNRVEQFNVGGSLQKSSFDIPSICPMCKHNIAPDFLNSSYYEDGSRTSYVVLTYRCMSCFRAFISVYEMKKTTSATQATTYTPLHLYTGPQEPAKREFSDYISSVSEEFVNIYNEALVAETLGLQKIAGVGYRKSIEFLIKDYITRNMEPSEKETIKNKFLGKCIKEDVANENVQKVAERAVWIGNDEAHYYRKHTDKDLQDLKTLIDLAARWIEMEIQTEEALAIERIK